MERSAMRVRARLRHSASSRAFTPVFAGYGRAQTRFKRRPGYAASSFGKNLKYGSASFSVRA